MDIVILRGLAASGSSAVSRYIAAKTDALFLNEYCMDTPHYPLNGFMPTVAYEEVLARRNTSVTPNIQENLEKKAKLEFEMIAELSCEMSRPLIIREWFHHYFETNQVDKYLKLENLLREMFPDSNISSVVIWRDPLQNFVSAARSGFWDSHSRNFHVWFYHLVGLIEKLSSNSTFMCYEEIVANPDLLDEFLREVLGDLSCNQSMSDIVVSGNSGRTDPLENVLSPRPERPEDILVKQQMSKFDSVKKVYELVEKRIHFYKS